MTRPSRSTLIIATVVAIAYLVKERVAPHSLPYDIAAAIGAGAAVIYRPRD